MLPSSANEWLLSLSGWDCTLNDGDTWNAFSEQQLICDAVPGTKHAHRLSSPSLHSPDPGLKLLTEDKAEEHMIESTLINVKTLLIDVAGYTSPAQTEFFRGRVSEFIVGLRSLP
jgi:hypothetical protein